jgi:rubrerythrin
MTEKKFCLRITDVIEPEQEAAVIEAVKDYVRKSNDELRAYFRATDSIEVGGLEEREAVSIREKLERWNVTMRIRGSDEGGGDAAASRERAQVICPRCGTRLESLDWRCPECFYEFPEYEYRDEAE